MSRWIIAGLLLVAGIAGGVAFGWYALPVEYIDTTPASLRRDFRTDYVLMVAEQFHQDRDGESARRQLAVLGGQSPAADCLQAVAFAGASGYAAPDVELLRELADAMQALSPVLSAASTPP